MILETLTAEQVGACIGHGGSSRVHLLVSESANATDSVPAVLDVAKLFHPGIPRHVAVLELNHSSAAFDFGIATPRPISLVKLGAQFGIRFERQFGTTMLESLTTESAAAGERLAEFGKLHARLHRTPTAVNESLLASARARVARLRQLIEQTREVPAGRKPRLLVRLDEFQGARSLCHFDFHPGNLLGKPDHWQIIDWLNAALAPPWADVATTVISLCFATSAQLVAQLPSAQLPNVQLPSAQLPSAQLPSAQLPSAQLPTGPFPNRQSPSDQFLGDQSSAAQLAASAGSRTVGPNGEFVGHLLSCYLKSYQCESSDVPNGPKDTSALAEWLQIVALVQISRETKLERRNRLRAVLDKPSSLLGDNA